MIYEMSSKNHKGKGGMTNNTEYAVVQRSNSDVESDTEGAVYDIYSF